MHKRRTSTFTSTDVASKDGEKHRCCSKKPTACALLSMIIALVLLSLGAPYSSGGLTKSAQEFETAMKSHEQELAMTATAMTTTVTAKATATTVAPYSSGGLTKYTQEFETAMKSHKQELAMTATAMTTTVTAKATATTVAPYSSGGLTKSTQEFETAMKSHEQELAMTAIAMTTTVTAKATATTVATATTAATAMAIATGTTVVAAGPAAGAATTRTRLTMTTTAAVAAAAAAAAATTMMTTTMTTTSTTKSTTTSTAVRVSATTETSMHCVGESVKTRICMYKNLYLLDGKWTMFVVGTDKTFDNEVVPMDKWVYPWKPEVMRFRSEDHIRQELARKIVVHETGLAVYASISMWPGNIGHALFDGLYPAFAGSLAVGVPWDRPWLPVRNDWPECFEDAEPQSWRSGDVVETYIPDEQYLMSLRTVRARLREDVPLIKNRENCKWKPDTDNDGEPLFNIRGVTKEACALICWLQQPTCLGFTFYGACYFKGRAGHNYKSEGRMFCEAGSIDLNTAAPIQLQLLRRPWTNLSVPVDFVVGIVRRSCMAEGVLQRFGMVGETRRFLDMQRDGQFHQNLVVRFEEIVFGAGGAGNYQENVAEGGVGLSGPPHYAVQKFRDRILLSHDFPFGEAAPKFAGGKVNVAFVLNKRFESKDRTALDDAVASLNARDSINAHILEWREVGAGRLKEEDRFKAQLKLAQELDVVVSSVGTAQMLIPFMHDRSVFVAVGGIECRHGCMFPGWMEQHVTAAGCPYHKVLFLDLNAVVQDSKFRQEAINYFRSDKNFCTEGVLSSDWRMGFNASTLEVEVAKAVQLVRSGFAIPIPAQDNLSPEARLLFDMCRRTDPEAKAACQHIQSGLDRTGPPCGLPPWPENIVYEVPPWDAKGECSGQGFYLPYLRQMRKEYGLLQDACGI